MKKDSLLYLNIVPNLYYCVCVSEQILQYAQRDIGTALK